MYVRFRREEKDWLARIGSQYGIPVSRLVRGLALGEFCLPWHRLERPPPHDLPGRLDDHIKLPVDDVVSAKLKSRCGDFTTAEFVRRAALNRLTERPPASGGLLLLLPAAEERALRQLISLRKRLTPNPHGEADSPWFERLRAAVEVNGFDPDSELLFQRLKDLEVRTRGALRFGIRNRSSLREELEGLTERLFQ